jgi:hypothetical protein
MGLTPPSNTAPKTWRPDQGDPNPLVGKLADVTTATNNYSEYPLAEIIDDQDVAWLFHAFRSIAKAELVRLAPEIGDPISVYYGGVPAGKEYHLYKCRFADGRSTKIDWSRHAGDDVPPVPLTGPSEAEEAAQDAARQEGNNDDVPF